jgi:hypothetical protein
MTILPLIIAAAAAQASPDTAPLQPASVSAAAGLFDRDWVLMNWALKGYDKDGDFKLSLAETAAAADAFRRIADADSDGRVTTAEYRAAREFVLARY